jgi:PAS domain S-box-containing protein
MARTLRLLLIEDLQDDADLIVRQLRSSFEVIARRAETEEELRESLGLHPWDCVMVDWILPALSGIQALTIINKHSPGVPVILVSGRIGEEEAVSAIHAGARDFVHKDHLDRLSPVVERVLASARADRARIEADQRLRDSEERHKSVVENQSELVICWLPDGSRTFVNRAACELFGQPRDRLIATNFYHPIVDEDRDKIQDAVAGLTPDDPRAQTEARVVRHDGQAIWHEWDHLGFFDENGLLVEIQSVARDASEHRKASEAEQQQLLLVEVLRDTAAALSSTLDLEGVLDRILANIGWVIPHDTAAIFYVEKAGARPVRLRGWEELNIHDIAPVVPLSPTERAALSSMVRTGKPIVVQDATVDPRWDPASRRLGWVRSLAAAPLFSEDDLFGALALFCSRPHFFTPLHVELLEGFASHAATATRNARLFQTVSENRTELQRLSKRVVDAQEDERRRISHELHDEVGQALTGIIINAKTVLNTCEGTGPPAVKERLEDLIQLAKSTLEQIRGLSHLLRPAMLDELGLMSTLEWFTERFALRSGLKVTLDASAFGVDRISPAIETTLYRVAQESLTNAARHANASSATVRLEHDGKSITLSVTDDGIGFDGEVVRTPSSHGGIGLVAMRERVTALAGELKIKSKKDKGTVVVARIPCGLSDT